MSRPAVVASVIAVVVAMLSGCATSSAPGAASSAAVTTAASTSGSAPTSSVSYTKGLPPGAAPNTTFDAYAVWAEPGRLYVVTFGSSSCPKLPATVTVGNGNRLGVTTKPTSDGPCTMDIGPTTSVVDVPPGVDDSRPVEVSIDGVVSMLAPH